MKRVTLRMPKQRVEKLDKLVEQGEYPNRSEAIRSFVREGLNEEHRNENRHGSPNWTSP